MTNTPNENQMLNDDEIDGISGGTVASFGGSWGVSPAGNPYYKGWVVDHDGARTEYGATTRREYLKDGTINFWGMGADGKEVLKGNR